MSLTLSFEAQVLTSHDWIEKVQAPVPTRVVQDDYDDGVQALYVTYSDGTRKFQRREWDSESHDEWERLSDEISSLSKTEQAQRRLAFLNEHSKLIEEEDLEPVGDTSYEPHDDSDDSPVATEVTLEELQELSMELRHEVYNNLTKGLGVFKTLAERFKSFTENRRVRKDFDFNPNAFERFAAKVGTHQYAELLDLRCFTPPGMKTTYLELLLTLTECQRFADDTLNKTILPLKQWVSFCTNDPAKLKSIRSTLPVDFIDPTKLSKQLSSQCTFTGIAQRPFGDCFDQLNELGKVVGLINDLMVTYPATSLDRFDTETKALSTGLVALSDLAGRLGDDKVSEDITAKLADCCYRAARQVEFYAVYQTVLRATFSALAETQQHWEQRILK